MMNANPWKYTDEPLKSRLKKNSISNILYFILTLPIMFVLTPMIINSVGAEDYGIWVIAGTVLVFTELIANFQTSSALSVMIPRIDPKKEPEKINEVISTLFVYYLAAAVFVCVAYFFLEPLIMKAFFRTSPEKAGFASMIMALSIYPFMANFVIAGIGYLAGAFNIFYLSNMLHIITSYVRTALMIWAVKAGTGITGVVYSQMGTLIAESIVIVFFCRMIFPPLRVSLRLFSAGTLSYMIRLSAKLFTARASNVLSANFDKLALGFFINPAAAGIYQLGAGIARYISNLPEMLGFASLLPASSELKRENRQDTMKVLADKTSRYTAFAGIFMAAAIITFGKEFIYLWLGKGYEDVYSVMAILACAYAISILSYPIQNILNGTGHEKKAMWAGIISSVITTVLITVFTWKMGIKGAAYAALASSFISLFLYYVYYVSLTGHVINLLKHIIKPAATGVILFMAFYTISQAGNWLIFFLKAVLYTAAFMAIVQGAFRIFDQNEINSLIKHFNMGKRNTKL